MRRTTWILLEVTHMSAPHDALKGIKDAICSEIKASITQQSTVAMTTWSSATMFQDFGALSERRRAEREQRKKRIIIGSSSVALLLVVVVGVVASLQVFSNDDSSDGTANSSSGLRTTTRTIEAVCSSTDYKHTCVSSLSKAFNSSSSGSSDIQPKDLLNAVVSAAADEVSAAFKRAKAIKIDDPKIKGAVEDCEQLYGYAKDELLQSLKNVVNSSMSQLPKREHDVKNWLSAVMSYQQTCIDGFPEGELKTKMEKAMTTAKQLTSNALAIVAQASSLLSMLDLPGLGLKRRLLSEADGLPEWVAEGERRQLMDKRTKNLKPNLVVAKDGSGDFTTISAALDAIPEKRKGRFVIYVKAGVYDESPTVTKKMVNVTMYGDGSRRTIVTGSKNFVDGTRTFQTATFVAIGDGFMAIAMGFRNTAGAIKHQAVALRVQSDRAIFLNCRVEGYQDTLYAQTHRQFYRGCVISGTVDFIFGDAAAVFQNCVLLVRRPLDNQQNIVTAQGRIDRRESTGFVLHNCRFVPDKELSPSTRSYLARPWKEYSRTIIMESTIGGFIDPEGYMPWEGDFALKTLFYAEYANRGPGAGLAKRVPWPGVKALAKTQAQGYTVQAFIQGADWIPTAGAPVHLGMYY
ncbi:putative pectinesterase/pectinesterase inhibitor 45 [Wolffia australiana]